MAATERAGLVGAPLAARASVESARTPDGWDLALHHYAGTRRDLPPVILCPGYACNRFFLDFDERYSLARFLARRGFDTWVLEPRGQGYSEPAISAAGHTWTFDDVTTYDLPTALAFVSARCSGRRLVWIGHSMGGMLMYAALGAEPALQTCLAGLITLASPVAFPAVDSQMLRSLGRLVLALPLPEHLPQRGALLALWTLIGWAPGACAVGMNPANIDQRVFSRALRRFICNVPLSMLRQLAEWSLTGEFRSSDWRIDYRGNLSRITTPVFIMAGAIDRLASPQMVRFAYDHVGSAQKRYREFGVTQGDSADYGHVDLIFGQRAPVEVFPAISTWIETEIGTV